jgi:DNA-binding beta-propeller fold protein YncE
MKTKIICSFITFLTIVCFLSPSILMGADYIFNFQFPNEILGLRNPAGIAVDSSENVYIADTNGSRIVKYDSSGNFLLSFGSIGTGYGQFEFPCGIAVNNSNVYVADTHNYRIQKFSLDGVHQRQWGSYGTGNGQFSGPLYGPEGVAVDSSGYVYVADTYNNRIQKFDSNGNYLLQWGSIGTGDGKFYFPGGIAVDISGYIYVADTDNHRIQKFSSSGVYQAQLGGFGTGNGKLKNPYGVSVDSLGFIYVADTYNNRIQKFNSSMTYQTLWGTKGSGDGQFCIPSGVSVGSSGNIYVADTDNHRIQKLNSSGEYQTQWGSESTDNGQFNEPGGITVDSLGYVYVADTHNNRIQKFDSSDSYLTQWGNSGIAEGQFQYPGGIAVDNSRNVYVADTDNNRIQKFDSNGVYLRQWGSSGAGTGQFKTPYGVAIDNSGNVYVADRGNNRIQKFNSNGVYQKQWGSSGTGNGQFRYPEGVAVDNSGYVYVAEFLNDRIQKFDSNGNYLLQWGSSGTGNGQFSSPEGIAVDSFGYVYVVDTGNHRIQKFNSNGVYQTQLGTKGIGNGQFNFPYSVTIDSSGKMFVADTFNHRIQIFKIGIMTTAPILPVTAGTIIPFSSSISVPNIITATLYYKRGGEASYQSAGLSQSGTTWSTTIPAIYSTTRGIAYYVDAVNNTSTHYYDGGSGAPNNISVQGTISISSKTTPPASSNAWNIIGPSLTTNNKSIISNIGIGLTFGTTWIAWRYNPTLSSHWEVPTAFGSNPVTSDPFDAGTSWFYALDGSGSYVINNVIGTSTDASVPFSVPLKMGWNLICNPFDFSVAWSDSIISIWYGDWKGTPTQAKAANYVDNRAIWYNPDTRAYVTRYSNEAPPYAMLKTKGQWLYSAVDGAYVVFPPIEYTGSPAPPSKPKDKSYLWKVEFTLKSSKGNDIIEAIADNKGQTSLRDINPPSLPISVSKMSFIRDGIELFSDRQKESNEMIWTLSADTTELSSLEWKLIGVPESYRLTLEDETGNQIDARQVNILLIDKAGCRYILKATKMSVPKATRLLANYPNPFNPDTWIPYELSDGSDVIIKIYTSAGQLVRTVDLGRKEAGYYVTKDKSAHWNGKNEAGESVASGLYFYSIVAGKYTSIRKMIVLK